MSLLNSRSINISSQKMIIIIQQHSTILEKLSFYRNISENIYKSPECLKMKENFVFKIGNLAIIDLKIMRGKNSIVIMVNNWGPNCLFLHICQSLFFFFHYSAGIVEKPSLLMQPMTVMFEEHTPKTKCTHAQSAGNVFQMLTNLNYTWIFILCLRQRNECFTIWFCDYEFLCVCVHFDFSLSLTIF